MIERDQIHLIMMYEVYADSCVVPMLRDSSHITLFDMLPCDVSVLPRGELKLIGYVPAPQRYDMTYGSNHDLCVLYYVA